MPRFRTNATDSAQDAGHQEPPAGSAAHFTHFDASGQAQMVDVGGKDVTKRVARAGGRILMRPETLAMVREGGAKKGDVLGVARIAAIQAAKRTSDLIPLAHQLGEVRGVALPDCRQLAAIGQPFGAVLADGLEHPQPPSVADLL